MWGDEAFAPVDMIQVIITAVVAFLVLLGLTKLAGNKQLSQMTMFDYVSGISTGSIAAEMATELESPLRPLTALAVFGLITALIGVWTNKSLRMRALLSGRPIVVFDDGVIYRENLKRAKLDLNEFLMLCRIGGFFDLSQLQTALLEHNGSLSLLPKEEFRPAQPSDLRLAPKQSALQHPVILDGCVRRRALAALGKDEAWLEKQLRAQGYHNAGEVLLALCDESGSAAQLFPMKPKKGPKSVQ